MEIAESHLRPDGSVWPPVTPEPPSPPGYEDPIDPMDAQPEDDTAANGAGPDRGDDDEKG